MAKIKLPKQFVVFGQTYKVEYKDLGDSVGGYCHSNGLIQINERLDESQVMPVLIHEFFHAVFNRVSLDQTISYAVEQIIVDTFAKALVENFEVKVRKK